MKNSNAVDQVTVRITHVDSSNDDERATSATLFVGGTEERHEKYRCTRGGRCADDRAMEGALRGAGYSQNLEGRWFRRAGRDVVYADLKVENDDA